MTAHVFHIHLTPDTEENIMALVDAIQAHVPGSIDVYDCLELHTSSDEIARAVESLFATHPATCPEPPDPAAAAPLPTPPGAPEQKRRRRSAAPEAAQNQSGDELQQVYLWRIYPEGREVNSISILLSKRKLQVGQRLQNRNRGWFEVFENELGKLAVRPIRSNGRQPVPSDQPAGESDATA